jgi:hypothetical protein
MKGLSDADMEEELKHFNVMFEFVNKVDFISEQNNPLSRSNMVASEGVSESVSANKPPPVEIDLITDEEE